MARKNRIEYNYYMRNYMDARYKQFKITVITKLGGFCVKCGVKEDLQVHHRDPKNKEFTIASGLRYKAEKLAKELDKCELLCRECHKLEHAAAHGGERRYRLGCRCDVCMKGYLNRLPRRLEKKRIWRAKRRAAGQKVV